MNRSGRTDSKHSLDGIPGIGDGTLMLSQPYQLYVERTDANRNMARFYALSIDRTLFGEACLTRRWGRIGQRGQSMVHHFDSEQEAVALFLDVLRKKRTRGYRPAVKRPSK